MESERVRLGLVYLVTPVVSACSLLYELLIAQTLAILAANTVVWYSLTVGTYLGAMGLGALAVGSRSEQSAGQALYDVEIRLSIVGGLAVIGIYLAHTLHLFLTMHDAEFLATVLFFGAALAVALGVGFLTGIELPLLIRLGNEFSPERAVTNRVLALDYAGALVAGVAFPLLLLPRLELFTIGFLTALVNGTVALLMLAARSRDSATSPRQLAANLALIAFLVVGILRWADVQQYFLKRYYYYYESSERLTTLLGPLGDRPDVRRVSSPYQKIDIVHDEERSLVDEVIGAYSTKFQLDPDQPRDRYLFLNGDLQVSSNLEEVYHEYFAHVPVILNGSVPRRVLVLGAGDGLLIRELVKYAEIEKIVHVDLDPELVELSRTDPMLTKMNGNALADPRVHTQIGDAYQFVRTSSERFDAIYLDFPWAVDYNLSKLYSREFFHFVGQRMAPGGYAVLDAVKVAIFSSPDASGRRKLMPWSEWRYHYNTLRSAGFELILPYVSTVEDDNPEARRIAERILVEGLDYGEGLTASAVDSELADAKDMLEQAFISIWKEPRQLTRSYRDLGIPLHVLSEKRFPLAFMDFPTAERIDPQLVNSIARPTLPAIPMWHIRSAW